jgi:SAM-dependent methyltransferase
MVKLRRHAIARAKLVGRRALPPAAVGKLRDVRVALKSGERDRTRRIFRAAATEPDKLPVDALENLSRDYPKPPHYGYDPDALMVRGRARAAEILSLPGASTSTSFLELGCWDGMVSWALQNAGKTTSAIDNRDEGFDERASAIGVDLRQMDAAHLDFADESFDFVFSYDAFEHFAEPDRVLAEISRVVKRGGHVWLAFGPLFLSPYGAHAFPLITVPYCHVLWSEGVIDDFAKSHGVQRPAINRWRIQSFRDLWDQQSETLLRVRYREHYNLDHLDLIRKYPSCFSNETEDFDDLIVSEVNVLFRKAG